MTGPGRPLDTWSVPVQGGQGNQVGSGNRQTNVFNPPVSAQAPHEVSAPPGTHNLPPASTVFVGRNLDQVTVLLGRSGAGVVVGQVAVHGLGGIGKSELVIHYGHAVKDRYPLVWWITADSRDNIGQGLVHLAARLQSTAAVAHGEEWAIGWLQAHPGWLLILDNVEDIADIRPLLGHLAGRGQVLITTRRDPAGDGWAPLGLAPLRLEPLGRAASVELLAQRTGQHDPAGADRLASELGDLPLALEQAAAYIRRHRGMDFHRYLHTLTTSFDKASRHGGPGGQTDRTIGRVWQVTMTTITNQSPLAGTVLDVMAWLAPDQLPQEVLYPLADDPDDVLDAIALLADHNMIKWQDDTVSVHRLVQAVTRNTHTDPTHEPTGPAARALHLLLTAAPTGRHPYADVADWPRWNTLLAHIDALYTTIPTRDNTRLLNLAERAANCRLGQGQATTAVILQEQVLADRRRVLGDKHPATLASRHSLADAYRSAGRVGEAITLYEQVLADRRRVLGDEHQYTLTSRYSLANAYESAGRVGEAITLHKQVLADRRRVLGDDHPATLASRRSLANAYRSAGRVGEAITLHKQVLADYRRVLGDDHPDTLISRHNLAIAYHLAGRFGEAITLYGQVLPGYRRVLGDDHPDTLISRHNLANAYHLAGRVGEAITLYRQVLADCRRVLDDDHPLSLWVAENLRCAQQSYPNPT